VRQSAKPGKPRDSTTTNAISRICAIKQEEEQFRSDLPAILCLDFQDLHTMDMSMTVEQFQPVISWNEHLTTGALWYALYGWKGAPVFEQCHYSHLDFGLAIPDYPNGARRPFFSTDEAVFSCNVISASDDSGRISYQREATPEKHSTTLHGMRARTG
jgi:hypothetical protein